MTQHVDCAGRSAYAGPGAEEIRDIARGLPDAELAVALREAISRSDAIVLMADTRRVALAVKAGPQAQWRLGVSGDFGDESRAVVEADRRRFKWLQVDSLELGLVSAESAPAYRKTDVDRWATRRDEITGFVRPRRRDGGRTGEIPADVRKLVGAQAGWHCQFEGCGENLWMHASANTAGNYSYFAHIIASSPDGPRGHETLSEELAESADNVMLLCDKCHRLIDRVSPDEYSAETLNAMRAANIAQVARLFSTLRYPSSDMIVIGGNIAGQTVQFDQRRAEDAMRAKQLRPFNPKPHWFAYNGSEQGDGTATHYWESLFDQLARTEIPLLQARLDGSAHGGARADVISVFPLHVMSVLVLAGRLIGEARSVELFQFERNAVGGGPGGQWAWSRNAKQPDVNKYSVTAHREPTSDEKEALLLVSLTDRVPREELPAEFYQDGEWKLPVVEVVVPVPSRSVIAHPEDLVLVGKVFDNALRQLQEQWRVDRIHCIPIAPAAACVRLGQKLQSRHQSRVVFYERARTTDGSRGQFLSTIEIATSYVKNVRTGREVSLM
ncbi:hypothetical protein WL77_20795 [Burkholderia ubonensis]|uniref:SAVED domain-containing protein n=1 Tax=Burkholderia ubonensis TaxID=101571 RepID=UPI00075AD4D0|nr:SAVED domain-containing protein [Burkholderia ubonensis]KWE64844.1 hypothetical protein WL77_20795 [Burkholderia ubonensis]KWE79813.1 hypothetical protein WL79_04315 [Burkholderia ubonensis]